MHEKLKHNEELWDLFTKREEYNPPFFDQYGRFPYYLSRHRNVFEPEVSKFLVQNGLEVEYSEGKKFAVCLTHDIDAVYPYTSISGMLYNSVKSLKAGKLKEALKVPFYNIKKNWDPWWNFNEIMALEEKYDVKSSFYFLTVSEEEKDFNFKVEDLEHEIGLIADKGWEIGLHGGHEAYNSLEEITKNKKRLEQILGKEIVGYRNHFLRFRVPKTWELLAKAGFKYDVTFGYADCAGFRNGMCHPFRPFNLNANREIAILEIPLTIMDCTLFDYMKLDIEGAWEVTKLLIDTVEKYKGVITILWHNTYMVNEMLRYYEKILKYCREKNAWMSSGEEVWKCWKGI